MQYIPAVQPQKTPDVHSEAAQQQHRPAAGPYCGPRPMDAAIYTEYAHGLQAQQHRQHGARAQQKRQQPVGHVFAVAHRPIRRVYPFHILRCMDQIREHVKCVRQKQQPQHSERRTSRPKAAAPGSAGKTQRQQRQQHIPCQSQRQKTACSPNVGRTGGPVQSHGGAPSKYASFPRHACPSPFLLLQLCTAKP